MNDTRIKVTHGNRLVPVLLRHAGPYRWDWTAYWSATASIDGQVEADTDTVDTAVRRSALAALDDARRLAVRAHFYLRLDGVDSRDLVGVLVDRFDHRLDSTLVGHWQDHTGLPVTILDAVRPGDAAAAGLCASFPSVVAERYGVPSVRMTSDPLLAFDGPEGITNVPAAMQYDAAARRRDRYLLAS